MPTVASVTRVMTAVVTTPPRYGMNPPMNTMTPSGPARGTPSSTRNSQFVTASIVAITAVPRR